jgi:biopolymer transport protein ExbD/biopolymer transport protein TolR
MRRFSQRNSLVTLNEINITPLLDLAFVLLIIFVITRPLLEGSVDMQLPQNMGRPDTRNIDRHNVRVVEISPRGDYWLQGRHLSLLQVEGELARMHNDNPRLIVDIRADKRTQWDFVIAVINSCLRNNITQFSARVAAAEHP